MGLTQVQELLARLYTEPELRERFSADPQGVGEALGLDAEEAGRLAQLPAAEIDRFARSLVHKRRSEVEKLLPLTRRALGPRFPVLFREHAARFMPNGVKKQFHDAVAFAEFLARRVQQEGTEAGWVGELAQYESAWLEAEALAQPWIARTFRYPVHQLRLYWEEGAVLEVRPSLLLWLRPRWASRCRHLAVSAPRWLVSLARWGMARQHSASQARP
jgi:hypothetical protein